MYYGRTTDVEEADNEMRATFPPFREAATVTHVRVNGRSYDLDDPAVVPRGSILQARFRGVRHFHKSRFTDELETLNDIIQEPFQ